MNDNTHISTSGGLLTSSFIEALRGERCNQPGTAPETFVPRAGAAAPRPQELANNLGAAWELLLEKWDSVHGRVKEMDVSTLRNRWLQSFFDVLDYDLVYQRRDLVIADGGDELRFPLSHRGWDGDGAPIIHTVAPAQKLDARADGRGGRSPHDLLQLYLIRSKEPWGVVTNGLFVRLLRDFRHTYTRGYIEFDLESIFESRSFADFRALYRLLHASRFVPAGEGGTPLERFYSASQAAGVTVGAKLEGNVRRAIEALGNGFLSTARPEDVPRDEAALRDFYNEILTVVYRILFLLFAEQREMMPGRNSLYAEEYSIAALRVRAEADVPLRDTHGDLWEGLRVTFRMVEKGAPALEIPSYNGMLFDESRTPRLNGLSCPNSALLAAVRDLTLIESKKEGVRQRISYIDLGVEEIGSIYEGLLDYAPRIATVAEEVEKRHVAPGEFFLDPRSSARKTSGSYYTHPRLVNELINSALMPVTDARLQAAGSDQSARERAILDLKVCDPACGSAHFLVAATNYLGQELAKVRAGDEYPPEHVVRHARRGILAHCIYGVDVNSMAVELAKVSLWINCAVKDLPLNFLDHRIKCGNSLIGTTPALMARGVLDASFSAVEDDDPKIAGRIKLENKAQRAGELTLPMGGDLTPALQELAVQSRRLAALAETDSAAVHSKAACYDALLHSASYQPVKLAADAWCAAFFWPLADPDEPVPTHEVFLRLQHDLSSVSSRLTARIQALAEKLRFFHWHLEFPEVFSDGGGFDCIIGNPPWEMLQLEERSFFLTLDPEIACLTGDARKRAIRALQITNPGLAQTFAEAKHAEAARSKFLKCSGRFPLTAVGKLNTCALFSEQFRMLTGPHGRAGLIVKSGLVTDKTNHAFFEDLSTTGALAGLLDFENREKLFPDVDSRERFCVITMTRSQARRERFAFYLTNVDQLADERRRLDLTAEDFRLLNPNTGTSPVCRTTIDLALTKAIYRRAPVLVSEKASENPWDIAFRKGLFNMTSASGGFRGAPGAGLVPLYESKLLHQFDHRWATYEPNGKERDLTDAEKADPTLSVVPRYWVPRREVETRLDDKWKKEWLIGFRDITNGTNERAAIFSLVPRVGIGDTTNLMMPRKSDARSVSVLLASLNSLCLDYVVRQKIGGTHLSAFYVEQLPVFPLDSYSPEEAEFIAARVLELVYTARDLQPFARDMGYDGPPFVWDEKRRAHLRAQLDAFYFHKYGLTEEETAYVLDPKAVYGEDFPSETFRVLKENETKKYGEYRTQRLVLDYYRAWERGDMEAFERWAPGVREGLDLGALGKEAEESFEVRKAPREEIVRGAV